MASLLALPEPPTAVVAASDLMALGAVRAVAEAGRSVPRDVSVVGFDDIQLAGHVHPPLTTLRQDKAGLGAEAGRALIALIGGEGDEPEAVTLPVELVVRGSTTSPPRGPSKGVADGTGTQSGATITKIVFAQEESKHAQEARDGLMAGRGHSRPGRLGLWRQQQ